MQARRARCRIRESGALYMDACVHGGMAWRDGGREAATCMSLRSGKHCSALGASLLDSGGIMQSKAQQLLWAD